MSTESGRSNGPAVYRRCFLQIRLLIARAAILVAVAVILVPPAQAQVHEATVAVEGMSCPFCAFGVEKKLRTVPGAGSVRVDLERGLATVRASEGGSIDIARIPAAVKASGFTPGTIEIVASGTIQIDRQRGFVLRLPGGKGGVVLTDVPSTAESRLRAFAQAGSVVRIAGLVREPAGPIPVVAPKTVSEA